MVLPLRLSFKPRIGRVCRLAGACGLLAMALMSTTPVELWAGSRQPGNGVLVDQLAAGALLVAARHLPDPNFTDTVVLLIEYSPDGAAGLVLNRRSGVALSRALPGVETAAGVDAPAFIGGPVSPTTVLALSRRTCEGCRTVAPDVHLVRTTETLRSLLARGADERRIRVYVGYAGWQAQQLEREVRQGGWRVVPASAAVVFDPEPATLWRRMLGRAEAVLARLLEPRWRQGVAATAS